MPYRRIKDLPSRLKRLPEHAKEIYMKAFNNAWKQYRDPKKRRDNSSREETAHKVAWSAVKRKFKRRWLSGRWVKR